MQPSPAGSRAADLARSAALITIATGVSRVTGFVRVVVVAAAMGTTFLANTYQTANTAPNVLFELVAAGVLTSVFVPTFVEYIVRGRDRAAWDAGNALGSVALVGLAALSIVLALLAPAIMRLLTLGVEDAALRRAQIDLGATWLRLFAPQVIFYGAGMIMTAALHAHRRFGIAAIAPIFNNVIVITTYVAYALMRGRRAPSVSGITAAETLVLGAGTTLGVVAMTLCLVPELRRLGWRFRFRFRLEHPAVKRAARLGGWALSYAGGYQAGLVVVLLLANRVEGGVAAYQWAYTFFYLPHALFGVPVFHVLFPEMAEHAARGEPADLLDRLRDGMRMLLFILVPIAALMIAAATPLARATLGYGVMTGAGADLVGRVIVAFAIGLPTYSVFLVFTRACYALGDTKTPALINGIGVAMASLLGALLFLRFSEAWSVAGLALGHSLGFAVAAFALGRSLGRRLGRLWTVPLRAATLRALVIGLVAFGAMYATRSVLPEASRLGVATNLIATAAVGGAVYLGAMRAVGAREMNALTALLRRRPA